MKNKFTEARLLTNEASVEDLFAGRLIRDLGYADHDISHKASITPVEIRLGSRRTRYSPDYILNVTRKPRVVIDAKGPEENIMDYVGQCVSYCATINRKDREENPVRYFMLTSGLKTAVFDLDHGDPLVELDFADCVDGNAKFERLKEILRPAAVVVPPIAAGDEHKFRRHRIEEVNAAFAWCHQHIYKKDALSQAAGFEEFVKIIFLKLLSDRQIRDRFGPLIENDEFWVPKDAVKFSKAWIEAREEDDANPLDTVQFRTLLGNLEDEIRSNRKKRIFKEGTRISLHADTIKEVVKKLEHIYLFGIDADLNGRLFETFLSATMRGKDLGQFFTPRSVAKLGTLLADPEVDKSRFDIVLDGCCGTGGFLIDVLALMWDKVDANPTLSPSEKDTLRREVAEGAIYGVDIAQEPNLGRLARMNMYLHGDGGSSIYEGDFLDKHLVVPTHVTPEVKAETDQLRVFFEGHPEGFADVVLTNPPFAKLYERKTAREATILDEYELAIGEEKLRSSLMFFERYYDVMKAGGRLVSIIDDGILSGQTYTGFRAFLRQKFLIRAVVSLPGDAFQRSQARVKTSIIILEKRDPAKTQDQGPVFKYACRYVGIDDPERQRTLPIDAINRAKAKEEIGAVADLYRQFRQGRLTNAEFIIPAEGLKDRLDVKFYEPTGRMVQQWTDGGYTVEPLSALMHPIREDRVRAAEEAAEDDDTDEDEGDASARAEAASEATESEASDAEIANESDDKVTYLVVGYDGFARAGDEIRLSEQKKIPNLIRIHTGDIVMSNINAVHGSICVVPEHLNGKVVTTEFTIFRANDGYDPRVVWALLRSPEIRSEFLVTARGAGRTRVKWDTIKGIRVPVPPEELATRIVKDLIDAEEGLRAAEKLREDAKASVESALQLATDKAQATLQAFRPPT
ncbi:MAG: N-6 DNA methylase [Fulvimarina manganoxydans]|uniref:N-6 DNA methylase n=1 Tax=Fulvimarina manganoxydans TaxID=937218 RepID=UPI002353DF30|nr:N-6 DNA methylase [Fulvimarina manganoxydans]MCK5930989.1 N-6 DNA methylase [Fulvimarina manganoxydans]